MTMPTSILRGGGLRLRLSAPATTPRLVFVFAGQSNMSAYSQTIILKDKTLASPYVPGYAQTAANEWTGSPPASADSGTQYTQPTLADYPCLYIENTSGDPARVWDGWGSYVKQNPSYLDGSPSVVGSYGPELSFLASHLAACPNVPIAAVKQALGGTSLRGDWLPYTVQLGAAQGGTSSTITLAASDFGTSAAYVGLSLKALSGACAGQVAQVTAYDATTKVATISPSWTGGTPASGDGYGIERLQCRILRSMMAQAAARLNASGQPWRWGGFVWMQGESGAHNTSTDDSQYLADARAFFAFVRSLTRSDLPVIVGRIGNNWGWEAAANSALLQTGRPNTYLSAAGWPYAAMVASYQSANSIAVDGRTDPATYSNVPQTYLTGARTRRATQVTLGTDAHCAWYSNDDLPVRPPYDLTTATNDLYAYHHGAPGNLAAGERAFSAYQAVRN